NMVDVEHLSYDFKAIQLHTLRSDIVQFINDEEYGIKLPDTLRLTSALQGTLKDYHTRSQLTSSNGDIQINGDYNDGEGTFNVDLQIDTLNLGELLGQPSLGEVSLQSKITGSGKTPGTLNADIDIDIPQL